MKVLTNENKVFNIDDVPEEIGDVRFFVLDYGKDTVEVDYYCNPLLFLESFNDVKVDIQVGPYWTAMPLEWSIICGDKDYGDLEVLQIKQINDRDFSSFVFNPITSSMPNYQPLEVKNAFSEVKWFTPKLKYGQLLAVPLSDEDNPPCIFITHQKNNKVPEVLDIHHVI